MQKKNVLLLFMLLIMGLALIGCGTGENTSTENNEAEE